MNDKKIMVTAEDAAAQIAAAVGLDLQKLNARGITLRLMAGEIATLTVDTIVSEDQEVIEEIVYCLVDKEAIRLEDASEQP